MAAEQPNNIKKPLCAGLLAHVDAGKTTLSEAMLYEAGARRTLGRVDHQDAFGVGWEDSGWIGGMDAWMRFWMMMPL